MQAEQAEAWLRTFLDYRLFNVGDSVVRVSTLFVLLVVLVVAYVASQVVQRAVRRLFRARGMAHPGTVDVMLRVIYYGIMAAAIAVGLQTVGIELAALFAAGAIFAIAVGFAMQNIAEKLVTDTVKNFTLRDSTFRIDCPVGVVYGSDPRQVIETLERAAERLAWRDPDHPPQALLMEFGDSSVNFEVRVWITDPWGATAMASSLNEAVWYALQEAGITIAFPQLDIHLDPGVARPSER